MSDERRTLLWAILVAAGLAILIIVLLYPVAWWCNARDEAHGQLPLQMPPSPRTLPPTIREMTVYDILAIAYQEQLKRLYQSYYEGYLTRPGHEREEDAKFTRGVRLARTTFQRAIWMVSKEPWEILTPLPEVMPHKPSDAERQERDK